MEIENKTFEEIGQLTVDIELRTNSKAGKM